LSKFFNFIFNKNTPTGGREAGGFMVIECPYTYVGMRIQIPDSLAERIDDTAEGMGYNSSSDFARESIRMRLDELESKKQSNGGDVDGNK